MTFEGLVEADLAMGSIAIDHAELDVRRRPNPRSTTTEGPSSMGAAALSLFLGERAALRPTADAVVDDHRSLTNAELLAVVSERVAVLEGSGCRLGELVALEMDNTVEGVCRLLACGLAGVGPLLLDPAATDFERSQAVRHVSPSRVWACAEPAPFPVATSGPASGRVTGIGLVSSGSSGTPKLVDQEWESALHRARLFAATAGYRPNDVVLCTTPLHHGYGLRVGLLASIAAGACVVLSPTPPRPGDIRRLLASGVTVVQSVPFVLRWLAGADYDGIQDVRLAISSGEPLPAAVADQWRQRYGFGISQEFGSTETGSIAFDIDPVPRSVGEPLPDVRVRIGRDDPYPDALQVRGAWGTTVYRSDTPSGVVVADQWFPTGDMAEIDGTGRIRLKGRGDTLINVSGNKVDPRR